MSLGLCRCRRVSLGLCRCRPSRRLGRRRRASPDGKGQVDACDVEQNALGLLGQHLGDLGRIHHHGPQLILLVELLEFQNVRENGLVGVPVVQAGQRHALPVLADGEDVSALGEMGQQLLLQLPALLAHLLRRLPSGILEEIEGRQVKGRVLHPHLPLWDVLVLSPPHKIPQLHRSLLPAVKDQQGIDPHGVQTGVKREHLAVLHAHHAHGDLLPRQPGRLLLGVLLLKKQCDLIVKSLRVTDHIRLLRAYRQERIQLRGRSQLLKQPLESCVIGQFRLYTHSSIVLLSAPPAPGRQRPDFVPNCGPSNCITFRHGAQLN